MRRFGKNGVLLRDELPLSLALFDALLVDDDTLIAEPTRARSAVLETMAKDLLQPRVVTADAAEAEAFYAKVIAGGHEGIMAKAPAAPYEAGRRGAAWLKVKPVHTLDLVVLAVEWGSGRRKGYLSNIHLGARDPETGGFVMLGKTFKGMTDAMLQWQTERFTELAEGGTDGWVVTLRPEQVVEIAFDGIQTSSRYPGGVALRFARVIRYRDDKTAAEADTIDTVRLLGNA
jgi:DNA ligase-1